MGSTTLHIEQATTRNEWHEAVIQFFEQEVTAKEQTEGISVAFRSTSTLRDWSNNYAFLADVMLESEGAQKAMLTFTPYTMDYKEVLAYYMTLWYFPRDILAKIEERLYQEQESAARGSNLDYQVLTSVAVTKLKTASAAGKMVKFLFASPEKKKILQSPLLSHLLDMGEDAQDALINHFLLEPHNDETHEVMGYITETRSNWPPFTSNNCISMLQNLLKSGEPNSAVKAVYLVYLFRKERRQFSSSLRCLLQRLDKNEKFMCAVVWNMIIYAEMPIHSTEA